MNFQLASLAESTSFKRLAQAAPDVTASILHVVGRRSTRRPGLGVNAGFAQGREAQHALQLAAPWDNNATTTRIY